MEHELAAKFVNEHGEECDHTEEPELTELEESQIALNAHAQDLRAEWDKPLEFDAATGKVKSGIFWIPPFVGPSPEFYTKKKVSKPKHKCAECGASHVDRRKR